MAIVTFNSTRLDQAEGRLLETLQSGVFQAEPVQNSQLQHFLNNVSYWVQPELVTLSSSRIEMRYLDQRNGTADYRIALTGSGIGPVSSVDALGEALANATVTGTLDSLSVTLNGETLGMISLSPSGLTHSVGNQSIILKGALPTSFDQFYELNDLIQTDLLDWGNTEFQIASQYGLTGMTAVIGGETVAAINVSSTAITMQVDDLSLRLDGQFPTDFGALAKLEFDYENFVESPGAPDANAFLHFLEGMSGLALTGAVLTSETEGEILRMTGSLGSKGIEMLTITGSKGYGDYLDASMSSGNAVLYADGLGHMQHLDEAQSVFRMYQATFNRAPDASGFAWWTDRLAAGTNTLQDVARGFVNSREFQSTYGPDSSNTDFLTKLYNNVLSRNPDGDGLRYWELQMDAGRSRQFVVERFSESKEFITKTNAASMDYIEKRDPGYWADDVFRLYQATINRQPDLKGWEYWTDRLASGTSFQNAIASFMNSKEYQTRYGSVDADGDFVELLYQNVLGRGSDAGGLTYWVGRIGNGMARAEVVERFAQSKEFTASTMDDVRSWVRSETTPSHGTNYLKNAQGHTDMWGGAFVDEFFITPHAGATVTVHNFDSWDVLGLTGFGYQSTDEMKAYFTQNGDDVIFADQGTTVTLTDTALATLDFDSFIYL